MDNQILDEPELSKEKSYTDKAFSDCLNALITFGVVFVLSFLILHFRMGNNDILSVSIGFLGLLGSFFGIRGLYYSIRSFFRKEPNSARKWVALVGNLFFGSIILLIIVANALDIIRGMS